jgi:pseudouridine-5'-phosphate glycosidase/pseudouridine kinase
MVSHGSFRYVGVVEGRRMERGQAAAAAAAVEEAEAKTPTAASGPGRDDADSSSSSSPSSRTPADILVAGSVAVDLSCDYTHTTAAPDPAMHTSNPASIRQSIGGVGHNVALAAHLAGGPRLRVRLCSLVGDDL